MSRGHERDRLAELREIFRHFDRDMDGRISGRELREFFASMGDGGAAAALGLDAGDGAGGDLMLGFEDFVQIVERKGAEEEERQDLRRAFEAFEAVKGSGRITPRGLQRVLSQLRKVNGGRSRTRPPEIATEGVSDVVFGRSSCCDGVEINLYDVWVQSPIL